MAGSSSSIGLLALIATVCHVQLANCTSISQWLRINNNSNCINATTGAAEAALQQLRAGSELHCVQTAQSVAAASLAVQFNNNTGQCSVFRYQSVCHLISAADEVSSCAVYAKLPVRDIAALRAMKKLQAAWVFDAQSGAGSDNLVCGQSKLWQAESVEWTAAGAKFDGRDSKMRVKNADFGNFYHGFTWLLRLKRLPARQVILEHYDCDSGKPGAHFWESGAQKLKFMTNKEFEPAKIRILSVDAPVLTADENQFINIGITGLPASEYYMFFYNGSFVSESSLSGDSFTGARQSQYLCFSLGHRFESYFGSPRLQGTVQAVAVANHMTEAEINSFFDLIT